MALMCATKFKPAGPETEWKDSEHGAGEKYFLLLRDWFLLLVTHYPIWGLKLFIFFHARASRAISASTSTDRRTSDLYQCDTASAIQQASMIMAPDHIIEPPRR